MTARDSDPELPELDPAEEARLAQALRYAFAPSELDPERHERLLAAALEDPFAPASAEELVESERFKRALEGEGDHVDLALARALSAAHAPKPPPVTAISRAALPVERRRATVSYLRFAGSVAALAAAAAVLLAVGSRERPAPAPDLQALTLAQSRSTAPLFQSAALAGAPSLRIDRIASVRERELRENRYALWGVR